MGAKKEQTFPPHLALLQRIKGCPVLHPQEGFFHCAACRGGLTCLQALPVFNST